MSNVNQRKHIRYKHPEPAPVVQFTVSCRADTYKQNALVEDESHGGLGCIYIGEALDKGITIEVKEDHSVSTRYEVARCVKLDKNVFRIGLKRLES